MTENKPIEVRPCQLADVAVLTATESPGARLAEVFFERQRAGGVEYLVGWLEGMPVGTEVLLTVERPELKNLQVRKEFRGRGLDRAIVAEAEDEVRESGLLVIGVATDNPAARRLYERLGTDPPAGSAPAAAGSLTRRASSGKPPRPPKICRKC